MDYELIVKILSLAIVAYGAFKLGESFQKYRQRRRSEEAREWFEKMVESGDAKIEKVKMTGVDEDEDDEDDDE